MQTAKMAPEAPEEIFAVNSYFCDKALHSAVPTGLLKLLAVFIFLVVGSSAKTTKFAPFNYYYNLTEGLLPIIILIN